jgi:hypothetical protein
MAFKWSTTTRKAGGLNFLACGTCRWQEWREALLGFDAELAVSPGSGKIQTLAHFTFNVIVKLGPCPWHVKSQR